MVGPFDTWRSPVPAADLLSSPLASGSSSPPPIGPIAPGRTSSTADPFSAASKAPPHALPLFAKNVPHIKHPAPARNGERIHTDTILGEFFNDSDGVSEQSSSPLSHSSHSDSHPEHGMDLTTTDPSSPLASPSPVAAGGLRRTFSRAFSRVPSHPYEALGPLGSPPSYSKRDATSPQSPSHPPRQKPRLVYSMSQRTFSQGLSEVTSSASAVLPADFGRPGAEPQIPAVRSDPEWHLVRNAVNKAFDCVRPLVHLDKQGLTYLPPLIADLGDFVALASEPRRRLPPVPGQGARVPWARRASEAVASGSLGAADPSGVQVFLGMNPLRIVPSALFGITNLRVLSLRATGLTHLPPAIGTLSNLRELNIGGNELVCLPSRHQRILTHTQHVLPAEIQALQLDTFVYLPNPFLPAPPSPERARRVLSTLATQNNGIPSLRDICIRRLLAPGELGTLLSTLESTALSDMADEKMGDVRLLARLDAARRSMTCTWASWPLPPEEKAEDNMHMLRLAGPLPTLDGPASISRPTSLAGLLARDDASMNPWFNRCPGRHHWRSFYEDRGGWPTGTYVGPRYLEAVETCTEWTAVIAGVTVAHTIGEDGAGRDALVPLQWRGCGRGCLAFLMSD